MDRCDNWTKIDRAQRARKLVNGQLADILRNNQCADDGVRKTEAIHPASDLSPINKPHHRQPTIKIKSTDCITEARQLDQSAGNRNVGILNLMTSAQPGHGFLDGIDTFENYVCLRSSLYFSFSYLKYPLPENSAIWSPNILIFAEDTLHRRAISSGRQFLADFISVPARQSSLDSEQIHEPLYSSTHVTMCDEDRENHLAQISLSIATAESRNVVVLIVPLQSGTYGKDLARLWKQVLCGNKRITPICTSLREVVFVTKDKGLLKDFERYFTDVLTQQDQTECLSAASGIIDDTDDILEKIYNIESQLSRTVNSRTKHRLKADLAELSTRLTNNGKQEHHSLDSSPETDMETDAVIVHHSYCRSDGGEDSYYHFDDEEDYELPPSNSWYEFK